MDFYDGMYEAGFDDPQDYLDALEQEYDDYLDSRPREEYVESEDMEAISAPYFVDYLASSLFKNQVKHLSDAHYYPKVKNKSVIMCASGTDNETGESYYAEYLPFREATAEDIKNLPDQVEDFVIRCRVQSKRDIATGEEYLEWFQPVTWFSYSKFASEDDVILSGGECRIPYWAYER